jgi:ATP-dependent DNA helicase PIF1
VEENNEMLISGVEERSARAEFLKQTTIIFWDEAPMANRAIMECIDELLRRLCRRNLPFGGKIFVCAGDFRQTCPVIRRGSRREIVDASIKSSPLWSNFAIRRLTTPIRNAADIEFANFVDMIGDGLGPRVTIRYIQKVETVMDLIQFVFPADTLGDPTACLRRSILAPTNRQVDAYNDITLNLLESVEKTYFASDSLKEANEANLIPEASALDYVVRHPPPGVAPFSLRVKIGAVYRLMRNLSLDKGLVKNTRCVVTGFGNNLITVKILKSTGGQIGMDHEEILIPRITFTASLPSSRYTLQRKQFPLAPAYATTFNSCQGLTLDKVGIDLTSPVFSHGQLYTALSRVRHRDDARIRLKVGQMEVENVTFTEILI